MRRLSMFSGLIMVMAAMLSCCAQSPSRASAGTTRPIIDRVVDRGELWVGTAGKMPPFNMKTKKGELVGLDIDLSRYIATAIGVEVKFITMPFFELLPALGSGKVDMIVSSMTITPKRNLKAAFVGPYFVTGKSFLSKRETIAATKELSSLNKPNISIAALKNSTSYSMLQSAMPKAKLVATDNYNQAVEMVLRGEVDALLADWSICKISTLRHPDSGLISLITPITYEPLGIALPPTDPLFVNVVENILDELEGSGGLDDLEAYWLEDYSWLKDLKDGSD